MIPLLTEVQFPKKKGRSLTRATRLYFGGQRASLKQGA
jgi:hypothetical protein